MMNLILSEPEKTVVFEILSERHHECEADIRDTVWYAHLEEVMKKLNPYGIY